MRRSRSPRRWPRSPRWSKRWPRSSRRWPTNEVDNIVADMKLGRGLGSGVGGSGFGGYGGFRCPEWLFVVLIWIDTYMCFDLLFLANIGKILVPNFGLFLKFLPRISFISDVLKFSNLHFWPLQPNFYFFWAVVILLFTFPLFQIFWNFETMIFLTSLK